MTNKVYLSLGSNVGEKEKNILQAIELIDKNSKIRVVKQASMYKTPAIGYTDQDWFVNTALEIETELLSGELLHFLQKIELDLGRVREQRWGPRTIDIDILLYGKKTIQTEKLTVPHPRMLERGFVLIPLMEIAPELMTPDKIILNDKLEDLQRKGCCVGIEKMI
ncbi:2-amino-4-hydroxy-6-hydroxymethyldihydropteridine diphosphokinase [Desulfitispora alkaliphila]|uniref:2-amino-4-hydroxy-6- hydroxymethyldihydropteridine diphosphokinase n=1 Tax=Desulfitispora alkaliphila TaxID=622674 RepID=UPI003D235A1A